MLQYLSSDRVSDQVIPRSACLATKTSLNSEISPVPSLDATKPVFGFSDKTSFKPVSSATETSYKIEISPEREYKGADQTAQPRSLVCGYVVSKLPKADFLASRPILCFPKHE